MISCPLFTNCRAPTSFAPFSSSRPSSRRARAWYREQNIQFGRPSRHTMPPRLSRSTFAKRRNCHSGYASTFNIQPQKCMSGTWFCGFPKKSQGFPPCQLQNRLFLPPLKSQAEAFRFSRPPPERFSGDGNRAAAAAHCGQLGMLVFPAAPESHFESSRPSLGSIPPADKAA